jgi:ATP-binding cassette subfamily B multidrug efflux pump
MIGEVTADLFLPRLMSFIVNYGITGLDITSPDNGSELAVKLLDIFGGGDDSPMHLIIVFGIMMLVLTLIGGIFGICCALMSATAAQGFGRDLRCDAYRKVMSLSIQQTDTFTTGSLITRMTNDITQIMDFIESLLRGFIRCPMFVIGGMVMLLTLNLSFGFVLLCTLPILVLILYFVLKKAIPKYADMQDRLDKVNSVVEENVNGTRVVKAYNREGYECRRFDDANCGLRNVNMHVLKLMAVIPSVLTLMQSLAIIAVIYIGGSKISTQDLGMTAGSIMAAITYVTQVMMQITMATNLLQSISRAQVSASRINEILQTEPVLKTIPTDAELASPAASEPSDVILSFQNVCFQYPGTHGKPVLKDINLDIKRGETLAVIGATGCGKTTLASLIPRFYDPVSGNILIDGKPLSSFPLSSLRKRIGYVMQQTELISSSVAANIRWGKTDASDEEVRKAAVAAQADSFIEKMPGAYDSSISEKGASLSGGQKQRLSIARALIRRPEIIILDDATSALDLSTETALRNAVSKYLAPGTTIIMIAQRIASVMSADRIAVIENDGSLLYCAPHDELLKVSNTYKDIYDSQMLSGAFQTVSSSLRHGQETK